MNLPFQFVTERDISRGALARLDALIACGAISVSDETLEALRGFWQRGGGVVACARFAEEDDLGKLRQAHPPTIFGCRVKSAQRAEHTALEPSRIKRTAVRCDGTRFRVNAKSPRRGRPALVLTESMEGMPVGTVLGRGPLFGFEDMDVADAIVESLVMTKTDAMVIVRDREGEARAVFCPPRAGEGGGRTGPALYLATDLSWISPEWAGLFAKVLDPLGRYRRAFAVVRNVPPFQPMPIDVSVRRLAPDGAWLVFVVCSPITHAYGGSPLEVEINFAGSGKVRSALTGEPLKTLVGESGVMIIPWTFQPGQVLVIRVD